MNNPDGGRRLPTRWARNFVTGAVAWLALVAPAAAAFTTFESGQVRPLALAPDGSQLFAVNTPDNRMEIFDVAPGGLTHAGVVPVGLEPVAVAVRPDGNQVWVVNHLSDSVSIVDLTATPPRVIRTLLVGDEPRDIVFAAPSSPPRIADRTRRCRPPSTPSCAAKGSAAPTCGCSTPTTRERRSAARR